MSEPLFGCRNSECATEISYPASLLAEHPDGGPVCEECWGECGDREIDWNELPQFVPKFQKEIEWLKEDNDELVKSFVSIMLAMTKKEISLIDLMGEGFTFPKGAERIAEVVEKALAWGASTEDEQEDAELELAKATSDYRAADNAVGE